MQLIRSNISVCCLRLAGCAVVLTLLSGCFGVVGGYYDGPGYVADYGPEVTVFGGYGHGHWDRDYSHRGAVSRGAVHGGGHFGGHGHR